MERVGFAGLGAADFMRSTGNTVYWGSSDARVERFGAGLHGFQVARDELDALLAREASDAGAQIRDRANVTAVERGNSSRITFEEDGTTRTIEAPWVLDCTGRVGVVARGGWRQHERAARTTALVGIWEAERWPVDDASHTIVESTHDGWAWSVPVSPARRYVTMMVDPAVTPLASRAGMDDAYTTSLTQCRVMTALVKDARRVAPVFARDASPYSARLYGERGVLLVGDAGSFVDPLSSYGIKKAVASAWLASVVVHSALLDASTAAPALDLFNARERRMFAALQRASAELAREAAASASADFWSARAAAATIDPELASEPDAAALRADPDVVRAFDELRGRDTLRVRRSASIACARRPTVRGNRVVVEEQLILRGFPEGVRHIRNVDLLRLTELAVQHRQVPDLFDAYNRAAPPVALPDFLGALSLLIGKGALEWELA